MQAIELETTMSAQSSILLPVDCRASYERHARMILLLEDAPEPQTPQTQRADRAAGSAVWEESE
jgi:hypothetical protein